MNAIFEVYFVLLYIGDAILLQRALIFFEIFTYIEFFRIILPSVIHESACVTSRNNNGTKILKPKSQAFKKRVLFLMKEAN